MSSREDSIPSAIDALFDQEEEGSAIDREFDRQDPKLPGLLDKIINPDFRGAAQELMAIGRWAKEHGDVIENLPASPLGIANLIGDMIAGEPALEEQMAVGAGVLAEGVLQPLEALAGLGTGLIGQGFNNRVTDFLSRAQQGLYTKSEQMAKAAGMTDEDIAAAHDVGGFIGWTAPIAASVKTAQLSLRTGQALSKHISTGEFVTDFTAGLIYGGIFSPGEGRERVKAMLAESASFGATRLILTGILPVMKVWRHKRALELEASGRISKKLDDIENGLSPVIDDTDRPGVLQLLEEEKYIIHSAAAQDLLRQGAYDLALAQAVVDLAERRGSGGIFKNVGRTIDEVNARVERFKTQFPKLKFSFPIKRADGYDIYFGTKGLSGKKLKQLKAEGRFEGQVLQYGDTEVLYVGRSKKPDRIKVKDADGRIKHVKESNITDTPFVKEDWEITPEWDALYKDFSKWLRETTEKVAKERGGIPEVDLIDAIARGRVKLPEDGRRAFDVGGALAHPEEIGLVGEDAVQLIEFKPAWTDDFGNVLPGTENIAAEEGAKLGLRQTLAFISRSQRTTGPAAGMSAIPGRNLFGEQTIAPTWRATFIETSTGRPIVHRSYNSLDEAIADMEVSGLSVNNVIKKYPTGGEVAGLITQPTAEVAGILDPMPIFSFEDLFDIWAKDRGLPDDAVDYLAAKHSFGDRFRREVWKEVPEHDRKIFEAIRAEQEALMADKDFPVEVLAHMKGFSLERLDGGRVRIRELNTGVSSEFGSDLLARKALQQISRPEVDIPNLIPMRFHGIHAVSGGYPVQDLYHFSDNIQSLETRLDLPTKWIRNVRDWLIAVENQTGIPLWSQGFDLIDQGKSRFLGEYDPWAKEIQKTWRGINRERKYAITDFWVEAESRELDLISAVKEMQSRGFSSKEIQAFRRSRAMFDEWFALSNIEGSRYIKTYYTRIRPYVEANGVLDVRRALEGTDIRPAEFQFWAEKARTGDIGVFEKDPELVMHKYIRGLLWDKHIKEHWDRVAVLTGTRTSPPLKIRDLSPEQQERIMRNAAPGTELDSPVLPKEMRKVLEEYLNVIRGTPGASLETIRSFSSRLFHKLGVRTDARVLEEFTNTLMSTWYGAAMGLRPALVARNMSQTIWMLYTRIGSESMGRGLELAMTREGFQEALDQGAIRLTEAGVPYGDLIHGQIIESSAEGIKGPASLALASAIRSGLRAGAVTRELTQRTLIPYSSSDQASRAWSYFAQKEHTGKWLSRFEDGKIGWEKFEEQGLSFFGEPIRQRFRLTYDYFGKEAALRFIGKMGADEANFIYGVGAQPAWMQSVPGRIAGMFGTWPLWAHELYFRRMRHATLPQQAALIARTLALTGMFANMTVETGINMWNWVSPGSIFGWSGGPAVEHAINLKEVIDAPLDEKGQAARRMIENGLRLSFPGQGFYRDLQVMGQQYDPKIAFLSMMLGRPNDVEHWFLNYQTDPTGDPLEDMTSPETADSIRIPWLPDPEMTPFQFEESAQTPRTTESFGSRQAAPLELLEGNL